MAESGRYDCSLGPVLLRSYNITMDQRKCATPTQPQDFQQAYADWCREFERYKHAMKTWQKKQLVSPSVCPRPLYFILSYLGQGQRFPPS